jgi:hypothetical protein
MANDGLRVAVGGTTGAACQSSVPYPLTFDDHNATPCSETSNESREDMAGYRLNTNRGGHNGPNRACRMKGAHPEKYVIDTPRCEAHFPTSCVSRSG